MRIRMKEQDLLELYQLLEIYQRVYQKDGERGWEELLEEIEKRYREYTGGDEIKLARNPRGAGRKRVYSEEKDRELLRLYYKEKQSLRNTAKEMGCSVGHVQDVIRRERQS